VEEKKGTARFVTFDADGNLQIRKGGQSQIASKFRSFYINKLQNKSLSNFRTAARPTESAIDKALQEKPVLS
jgi:hypothetical protein